MVVTKQDVVRFWSKVDRSGGNDACWPWTAGSVVKGYGTFWLASEHGKVLAHRVASQAALGAEYGVNQGQVSKILSGRRWGHLA